MGQFGTLQGKNILITGAASGIGKETAMLCEQLGARVILVDCSEEGIKAMAEDTGCEYYVLDLSRLDEIEGMVKSVVEKDGAIDGLVHCAGISSRKPLRMLTLEGFEKILKVNFYSFVELVKSISKKGRFGEHLSIVVMSSVSSIKGYKAKAEYCVSKAAVDAFVRCAALELADKKIRVNSVMAGEVDTPLRQKALAYSPLSEKIEEQPLGVSSPDEVASIIAFLLSDMTKTLTGTSVKIDGGMTI